MAPCLENHAKSAARVSTFGAPRAANRRQGSQVLLVSGDEKELGLILREQAQDVFGYDRRGADG